MKNARYLIEYYRDEYNTLHQGIEIDLKEDEASNGRMSQFMRNNVNPNLTICYERIFENEKRMPIRIERLINGDFVEIDVNTFKPVI